jgi:hypothetical protein
VPRRIGSHSLGEFPLDVVRIECPRCNRAGSYRRDGLVARFGVDIALPDLLLALARAHPTGVDRLSRLRRLRSIAFTIVSSELPLPSSALEKETPLHGCWPKSIVRPTSTLACLLSRFGEGRLGSLRQKGAHWRIIMRNDLCIGLAASRGSGINFASTSRLPTISAALMASLVFAVALGASGSARAACGGGGSAGTGAHPASAGTGVHTTTSTAPSRGTGVHGVSSCGTSNSAITGKTASAGGLAGVDPKTHTSPIATTGGLAGVDPKKVATTGGLAGVDPKTRTSPISNAGGLAGVDPKTRTSPHSVSGTTSNLHPNTTVHASANLHGIRHH